MKNGVQELTDEELETMAKKIMALPGVTMDHDSDFIAEPEEHESGPKTYIKFMSNHGVTDDANGAAFTDYMRDKGYRVLSDRPRSMVVEDADLRKEFLS